jgi:hypothetical protein
MMPRLFLILASIIIVVKSSIQQAAATDVFVRKRDRRRTISGAKTTFIVTFADTEVDTAGRCAALANSVGGTVNHVYDQVLNGCSLTSSAAQSKEAFATLGISSAVQIVEEDQEVFVEDQPAADNIFESTSSIQESTVVAPSWGLDRINQCGLPLDTVATKQDATGAKVFIIDTGIYAEHEEFANGVISTDDCHFSIFPGEAALSDGYGHG